MEPGTDLHFIYICLHVSPCEIGFTFYFIFLQGFFFHDFIFGAAEASAFHLTTYSISAMCLLMFDCQSISQLALSVPEGSTGEKKIKTLTVRLYIY